MHHLGMMYFAEYFNEAGKYDFHRQILFGKGVRGSIKSDNPDYGLIGQMKIDTLLREEQQTPDMEYGQSARDLVGRGERHRRQAGAPYYEGDPWY